jgi:predicted ester cyclase
VADNASIIRRLFEDGFTGGNPEVIAETFSPNADYQQPGVPDGMEGLELIVQLNNEAFAGWRVEIEDLIDGGDRVAVRWTARGTHESTYVGEGPTGRQVSQSGISIYQLHEGRVTAAWSSPDSLGLLQQLAVIPAMALVD